MSGYQDSNLGPPAPKAGALTGLRYIPQLFSRAKVLLILKYAILSEKNIFVSAETILRREVRQAHQNNKIWVTISPERAILLHSPGRKPSVNYRNIFIEPQRGGTPLRKQGLIADTSLLLDLAMIRRERTTSYALSASKPSMHYRSYHLHSPPTKHHYARPGCA